MSRPLSQLSEQIQRKPDIKFLRYVKVEDFLEHFDIANIELINDYVKFSCPFPGHSHGDEHPSAIMNTGTVDTSRATQFTCFGCGRRGNAISFLADHEGISRTKARRWLQEHYARDYLAPKGGIAKEFEQRQKFRSRQSHTKELEIIEWDEYERFAVDWHSYTESYRDYEDVGYMFDRGFNADDLGEWRVGYDKISDRITIPICDYWGNLVGVKGRAWRKGHEPRYLVLGDKPGRSKRYGFPTFEKSLVVYGLDHSSNKLSYVFCEGEVNQKSLEIMGFPSFCTGGATMSAIQERIIRNKCEEVIMMFDDDNAGNIGLNGRDQEGGTHIPGIIERLEPFMKVNVVSKHDLDANDYLRLGKQNQLRKLIESAVPSYLARSPI